MSELKDIFSGDALVSIQKSGFKQLYDFITYCPKYLIRVKPFDRNLANTLPDNKQLYLLEATITSKFFKSGKSRFVVFGLQPINPYGYPFEAYFFATGASFVKSLQVGNKVQVLLKYNNNYWVIKKISKCRDNPQNKSLILGRSEIKEYYLPVYEKKGEITSQKFYQLHRKIPDSCYVLDLKYLIPKELGLAEQFSIINIHKPKNLTDFLVAKKNFLKFTVFLKLFLIKYLNSQQFRNFEIPAGVLDLELLKSLSQSLSYQLTFSQKQVIWKILNLICINEAAN